MNLLLFVPGEITALLERLPELTCRDCQRLSPAMQAKIKERLEWAAFRGHKAAVIELEERKEDEDEFFGLRIRMVRLIGHGGVII